MRIKMLVLGALLLVSGVGCYHTAGICDCSRNGVLPLCGCDGPYGSGYEHGIHPEATVHADHAAVPLHAGHPAPGGLGGATPNSSPVVAPSPAQLK